jgi:hypothetical protein
MENIITNYKIIYISNSFEKECFVKVELENEPVENSFFAAYEFFTKNFYYNELISITKI